MKYLHYVTLGGLASIGAAVAFASTQVARLDQTVASSIRRETPMTLTEQVTRKDGRTTTVTTTRGSDESLSDFIARHDAAVTALKSTP